MSKFTLCYFGLEARAGPIRNACAIGKVPYEDKIVTREEWPKMKETLSYGQLPVIVVGDLTINQSTDILRYVSKLAGLYPEDPLAALQVDSLISNMSQIIDDTVIKSMSSKLEKDDALKMRREFLDKKEGKLGMFLAKLDLQIGVSSTGYLFEFGLTGADLQLFMAVCFLSMGRAEGIPKTYIRDNFANLEKFRRKVASIDGISERFKDERHPFHKSVYTVDYKYEDDEKKSQ
jgi:glutathione S-transferase